MPRVNTATKSNRGNEVHCRKCSKKIEPGQKYYFYSIKTGPRSGCKYVHCEDHRPKQSDLTNSKMSGVYAAQETAEEAISKATAPEDIAQALRDAASEVENVKDEYQSSLDSMPEGLQQGDTGQQIQEKLDALEEYQGELKSAADEVESADWPEAAKEKETQAAQELEDQRVADEREEALNEMRETATSALGNLSI